MSIFRDAVELHPPLRFSRRHRGRSMPRHQTRQKKKGNNCGRHLHVWGRSFSLTASVACLLHCRAYWKKNKGGLLTQSRRFCSGTGKCASVINVSKPLRCVNIALLSFHIDSLHHGAMATHPRSFVLSARRRP